MKKVVCFCCLLWTKPNSTLLFAESFQYTSIVVKHFLGPPFDIAEIAIDVSKRLCNFEVKFQGDIDSIFAIDQTLSFFEHPIGLEAIPNFDFHYKVDNNLHIKFSHQNPDYAPPLNDQNNYNVPEVISSLIHTIPNFQCLRAGDWRINFFFPHLKEVDSEVGENFWNYIMAPVLRRKLEDFGGGSIPSDSNNFFKQVGKYGIGVRVPYYCIDWLAEDLRAAIQSNPQMAGFKDFFVLAYQQGVKDSWKVKLIGEEESVSTTESNSSSMNWENSKSPLDLFLEKNSTILRRNYIPTYFDFAVDLQGVDPLNPDNAMTMYAIRESVQGWMNFEKFKEQNIAVSIKLTN